MNKLAKRVIKELTKEIAVAKKEANFQGAKEPDFIKGYDAGQIAGLKVALSIIEATDKAQEDWVK